LWAAQTPQCFKADILKKAYKNAFESGFLGTDDSMLVERIGIKIKMVEGSYDNIKFTTPEDIFVGERILEK
jgi:2-C-methyl-D-erythritol 4-phosphate cytidylyltransferase